MNSAPNHAKWRNEPTLDLSSFPRLELLRICASPSAWPWIIATLSTITSFSHIRKIIFVLFGSIGTSAEEFDSLLSNLPISPTVEFQLYPTTIMPNLPLLRSKNMVRHISTPLRDLILNERGLVASPRSQRYILVPGKLAFEDPVVNV